MWRKRTFKRIVFISHSIKCFIPISCQSSNATAKSSAPIRQSIVAFLALHYWCRDLVHSFRKKKKRQRKLFLVFEPDLKYNRSYVEKVLRIIAVILLPLTKLPVIPSSSTLQAKFPPKCTYFSYYLC